MKSFKVTITETLQMDVEIEASSRTEAERLAEQNWKNSDYILDAECFKDVKFRAERPERERNYER